MQPPRSRVSAARLAVVVRDGRVFYLAVSTLISASNFLFHVIYTRFLGPAQYGILSSLLGIVVVLVVPLAALQLAASQAQAGAAKSASIVLSLLRTTGYGLVALIIGILVAPVITSYLNIRDQVPFDALLLYIWVATISVVPGGALIGQQRFRALGISTLVGTGVARMVFGYVFGLAGFGVTGALMATAFGATITLLINLVLCREQLGRGDERLRVAPAEGALSLAATIGLALIGVIDTVLARHVLSGDSAGFYLISDTTGRIALFAPSALALVLFPRFDAAGRERGADGRGLVFGVAAVGSLGGVVALVLGLWPRGVISILFGDSYLPGASLVPLLAVEGVLLGCVTVVTYYGLAMRSRLSLIPWGGALSAGAVVLLARPDARAMAGVIDAAFLVTLVSGLGFSLAMSRRRERNFAVPRSAADSAGPGPTVSAV